MTYSMARFSPASSQPVETDLIKIIQATTESIILDTSLAKLISRRREKKAADDRAKRSVKLVMELIGPDSETEATSVTKSNMFEKVITRFLKFVGKQVFKRIIRPVFEFAARAAMNIVRFAIRSLVRYAIVPAIEAIVALAVANPITAGVVAALAVAGGGYWIWKKFFSEEAKVQQGELPAEEARTAGSITPSEDDIIGDTNYTAPTIVERFQTTVATVAEKAATAYTKVKEFVLGGTSSKYESAKGGAGTISSGTGDYGGMSYGLYQLSSNQGSVDAFLTASGYDKQFKGLTVGTPEFNAKWKQLAATDPGFATAQHDYAKTTYYDKQLKHLKDHKVDLSTRGPAIQDAIWSTAVQFGGKTSLILEALKGKDYQTLSDADIIKLIQGYKRDNLEGLFKKSSEKVRAGVRKRIDAEEKDLLALDSKAQTQQLAGQQKLKEGISVDKQASVQGAPAAGAATSSTSEFAKPDREIVRGKGKALIGVS